MVRCGAHSWRRGRMLAVRPHSVKVERLKSWETLQILALPKVTNYVQP